MREIKFRMWDTEQKGWVMPPNHQVASSMPMEDAFDKISPNPKILMLGEHTGRYALMQYTGLKDKNGKEIYEGDIVKWWDSYGDEHFHEVKWSDKYLCFDFPMFATDERRDFYLMEIIGNIYENPELLK